MDFFEKMGEKIAEAGTGVSKKAKEVSSVVSLKNKIRTEENKVQTLYQTIGEKYFKAHQEYEGDVYADEIASILAAQAGIETLKEQINELQGTRTCAACGESVDKDAAFCPKCGAKIS